MRRTMAIKRSPPITMPTIAPVPRMTFFFTLAPLVVTPAAVWVTTEVMVVNPPPFKLLVVVFVLVDVVAATLCVVPDRVTPDTPPIWLATVAIRDAAIA
jgi:hypothetical protein